MKPYISPYVDIIVSRHPAAIQFIRETMESPNLPVVAQATADDVRGKHVVGNLPLHLAALAKSVTSVEFSGSPPRGSEYSLEEMKAAGAHLSTYKVERAYNSGGGQTMFETEDMYHH